MRKRRFVIASLGASLGSWLLLGAATGVAEEAGTPPPATKEAQAPPLAKVVDAQLASDREAAASQERVQVLDDETRQLLQRYKQLTSETRSLHAYSDQLEVQLASQASEVANARQQLVEIERTAREVIPMMEKMLELLDRFVALDVPFLLDERVKRIEGLKAVMQRADVTTSEKYRRIMEAYQIELDYGRTIEAYQGELPAAAEPRTVQFLRLGRVALLYQTLDGNETAYWDADKKGWVVDETLREAVKRGVSVALKQGAPELLMAPVRAPREAQS
jgi:hypothetical protein